VQHWDAVVAATQPRFREVPLQHTARKGFSWAAYRDEVAKELQRVRNDNTDKHLMIEATK
jgi:hypothetical protein